MTDTIKNIKHRIIEFLNSATSAVMHSYGRYLSDDMPKDTDEPSKTPEEFKKYHDAGKSAASHLETLMKLTSAADDPKAREGQRAAEQKQIEDHKKQMAIKRARDELERRK